MVALSEPKRWYSWKSLSSARRQAGHGLALTLSAGGDTRRGASTPTAREGSLHGSIGSKRESAAKSRSSATRAPPGVEASVTKCVVRPKRRTQPRTPLGASAKKTDECSSSATRPRHSDVSASKLEG